ncbi:MAG: putative deoxyhypusine synthase [Candidatus Micrarchaeota archaeon]|nr:MAG: putative deoxyhypusine synthase [Candidatus Micrarchaeota archaeon]
MEDLEVVKDVIVKEGMSVEELVESMSKIGGFSGQHMIDGIKILKRMKEDKESYNFLSFTADIVATGLRGTIAQMVKHFDAIITTCGTLDHDIAKANGARYRIGSFYVDDRELFKKDIYRLGNVFIERDDYGLIIEKKMKEYLDKITKDREGRYKVSELLYKIGSMIKDNNSILRQAYLNNVPIYVPGIVDGAVGTQLALYKQEHNFDIDILGDELDLANKMFEVKKSGALMIGGGISKHHVIWWNQFKNGLDYAVYITTANQFDGSLSGARLTEAISWGKVKAEAMHTTIDADVTLILPLMAVAAGLL